MQRRPRKIMRQSAWAICSRKTRKSKWNFCRPQRKSATKAASTRRPRIHCFFFKRSPFEVLHLILWEEAGLVLIPCWREDYQGILGADGEKSNCRFLDSRFTPATKTCGRGP